jgi:serine/threonine protein phosphatase PrpC
MHQNIASKNRAKIGEQVSGDKVIVREIDDQLLLAVIDGVGHGSEADLVSQLMADYLNNLNQIDEPARIIEQLDQISKPCIGAAVGIVRIKRQQQQVDFAGVGNIAGYLMGHHHSSFASRDGSVGCHSRTALSQSKTLAPGDLIIMHSDGIKSRLIHQFDEDYLKQSVDQILSYIFNNFEKEYDDASCVVYRF